MGEGVTSSLADSLSSTFSKSIVSCSRSSRKDITLFFFFSFKSEKPQEFHLHLEILSFFMSQPRIVDLTHGENDVSIIDLIVDYLNCFLI